MTDAFDSIRPYRDDEVRPVLDRLLCDRQFMGVLAGYLMPGWMKPLAPVASPLLQRTLRRRMADINSVQDFQNFLEDYFVDMMSRSTSGFTSSGVDALDPERAHLFVSNHRDIAMDSGFMNYALHAAKRPTSRIAIGDNLLTDARASDLMRLNKSFIVERPDTAEGKRGAKAMFAAFNRTSGYLHHSIVEEGVSVWIAQRQGRAKDGRDRTDPAVLKMFAMSQRKSGKDFAGILADLNIVPVAVSYEFDPCDLMKARELSLQAADPKFRKAADADLKSIVQGITGQKGHVHVHFGTPLSAPEGDADLVAASIDRQVVAGCRLYPTHIEAMDQLGEPVPESLRQQAGANTLGLELFRQHLAECPAEWRDALLAMYANPVRSRIALDAGLDLDARASVLQA